MMIICTVANGKNIEESFFLRLYLLYLYANTAFQNRLDLKFHLDVTYEDTEEIDKI